ncbi:helix-hairpin-helix domain-containing protein [Aeromicrobium sp. CTD01-1L150]|uniref:helix-hairpin-helix domain-containing protein n=1 Tax=Aeromicrobium sp. CTD01-1L150 TaxID=3341830 RepID=UPI0035C2291A
MTTAAQLRKACLAQPEVEQVERDGQRAWAVDGTVFAALDADGHARLDLARPDAERMAEELDGAVTRRGGVTVDLPAINGMALNHWVRQAWRHRAPRRLVVEQDEAARAASSGATDLPAVGRAATGALHASGLRTLDDVAARSPDEVAALHGVGPKAVRILREALADRGVSW